jgi:hypothetical protein
MDFRWRSATLRKRGTDCGAAAFQPMQVNNAAKRVGLVICIFNVSTSTKQAAGQRTEDQTTNFGMRAQ